MKTNVMCPNCGGSMIPMSINMVRDDKNGNIFIDVWFCCQKECNTSRYIRYTEYMSIDKEKYILCLDNREIIHSSYPYLDR